MDEPRFGLPSYIQPTTPHTSYAAENDHRRDRVLHELRRLTGVETGRPIADIRECRIQGKVTSVKAI